MVHSPIKSFGGKGGNGFMKTIYSLFPKDYSNFIEPFAGSAVIALNNNKKNVVTVINDLNKNIYSFFKVIQNKDTFKDLKEKLDIILYSEKVFRDSLAWLREAKQDDNYTIEDRAYHFFVVNRMSHSANMASFSTTTCIRRGVSKSISDIFSTIDGLPEIHRKLQEFIIMNRDALDIIEKYNRPDTFFFLDSPYTFDTRTAARYEVDMDMEQQERYINLIAKGCAKYLVCGYDNPLYHQKLVVENGWKRYDYTVRTVSGKNVPKEKVESLWYNYEIEPETLVQSEINF
jgi:DNA adenine methylase